MKPSPALLLTLLTLASPSPAAEKPNVLLIYADDVGYGDLGAYGAKLIPTPNLDRMAAEGLRFTDAHCSAATCTPSRYSLLTGQSAFRKKGTGVLPGDASLVIDPGQFTLADVFQNAGYQTAVIGKWHLGLGNGTIDWNGIIEPGPAAIGFAYSFIIAATNDRTPCVYIENNRVANLDPADPITLSYGKPIPDDVPGTSYPDGKKNPEAMTYYKSTHGHNFSVINGIGRIGYMKGGKSALWKDEDMADVLMDKARAFLTQHKNQPFFLYFAPQNIHAPRTPNPRFHGKSQLSYRGDSMVELDGSVGELLKLLDQLGLKDNTLVLFSSDNGPTYDDGYDDGTTVETSKGEVDRGHDGSGIFRGGKYQIYEGGTRIPLIARWPGKITPGTSDALLSQTDFLASFASLLAQNLPPGAGPDSRNHLDALLGKNPQGDNIILEEARAGVAIRKGHWKYFETGDPAKNKKKTAAPKAELYDLQNDPSESKNAAADHPEVAAELAKLLARYRNQPLNEK